MRVGSTAKKNKADFNLELSTPDGYNFTINAGHNKYVRVGVSDDDVRSGLKTKSKAFFKENEAALNLKNCENWPFYKFIDFSNSDGLYLADFSDELTFSLVSENAERKLLVLFSSRHKNY